ncbi:MAG: thiolase family protein [Pirellulaceae bacterium]
MIQFRGKNGLPPLAVIEGVRTPFAKAFTALAEVPADELGRVAVERALSRCGFSSHDVDEVVMGNVAGQADAANIARVIALRAGIPQDRPAHSVSRNCASGMESVFSAWQIIREGRAEVVVAGGTESMSQVPLLWRQEMQRWLLDIRKASFGGRLRLLARLRPHFFKPASALELGLTDPVCGLNMGQTAEVLAKEFHISRSEQDAFALTSHQRATAAWEDGFYTDEVTPVAAAASGDGSLAKDVGPRARQSLEALAKLPPIFEHSSGTITAGNSCPLTDGAAALVLMAPERAKAKGLEPLGYIRGYALAGCDPKRMGLGPVFAIYKLLQASGLALHDFELFEINEAFAAQVLACCAALSSREFTQRELGASQAIGEIDPGQLNIHGGAIALGHPVGASGTRLMLTLLRSLKERGRQRGLAALCVGGGQGAAVWLEQAWEGES